jgi:hypothetical protein
MGGSAVAQRGKEEILLRDKTLLQDSGPQSQATGKFIFIGVASAELYLCDTTTGECWLRVGDSWARAVKPLSGATH